MMISLCANNVNRLSWRENKKSLEEPFAKKNSVASLLLSGKISENREMSVCRISSRYAFNFALRSSITHAKVRILTNYQRKFWRFREDLNISAYIDYVKNKVI